MRGPLIALFFSRAQGKQGVTGWALFDLPRASRLKTRWLGFIGFCIIDKRLKNFVVFSITLLRIILLRLMMDIAEL